jgi:hypothetical protein
MGLSQKVINTGATAMPSRTIHITGTKGEISGTLEEGTIVIRRPNFILELEYKGVPGTNSGVFFMRHGGPKMALRQKQSLTN